MALGGDSRDRHDGLYALAIGPLVQIFLPMLTVPVDEPEPASVADMIDSSEQHGFETLAIHAGQEPDPTTGAVVPPIYAVTTFKQDGVGGVRSGYEYSRSANPTRTALEDCLAALENGRRGLAFASGLAAEDTLLRTVCSPATMR